MTITLNDEFHDREAWDAFVENHDQARFCHLYAYSDVVGCYGYKPVRIALMRNREIVAVLPAAATRSLLFGRKLVSQPFSEYGGLLIAPSLAGFEAAQIYRLLEQYLSTRFGLHELEMHGAHGIPRHLPSGPFVLQNPHHVAVLALDRPADELWSKIVQYSVRKGVNKARAQGVEAFEACNEKILRERFYPLYLKSMKRLGVPPHALSYYMRCLDLFGDRLKIFWASRENEVLAGLLGFVCGGRVNIVNIVSTPEAWKFAPNDLIHWKFIKWASEAGFRHFDFGSVRYEGQRTYKKKWGVVFEDHGYFMLSTDAAETPRTFDSSSRGMANLAKIWSDYVPEKVAEFTGPFIRKQLVR